MRVEGYIYIYKAASRTKGSQTEPAWFQKVHRPRVYGLGLGVRVEG